MFGKIIKIIKENKKLHKQSYNQLKELEWAHVYHDSIRGRAYLENLPINIGRWAGNYAFFYVLNRILFEHKPNAIIEFGLGESSRFISTYLDNHLLKSKHVVIEQSDEWRVGFEEHFKLSDRSEVKICDMIEADVKGYKTNQYKELPAVITEKFDLYIVDGPFGSKNYSRYDIVYLAERLNAGDEFIIIMDDYQRNGEIETTNDLEALFKSKGITVYQKAYRGNKSLMVIATEKYKNAASY